MYHGLNNQVLYSAARITVTFDVEGGEQKSKSGTCFLLRVGKPYLVTNRHCMDLFYKKKQKYEFIIRAIEIEGRFWDDEFIHSEVHVNNVIYSKDYDDDFVCFENPDIPVFQKKRVENFIPENLIATEKVYATLNMCDFLALPGYPEWYDQAGKRPILRMGNIASDPRFPYKSGDARGDCMAFEAFSKSGSSGSPVFATQVGIKAGPGLSLEGFRPAYFVGIDAGHLTGPDGHGGISYLYRSTAILRAIRGSDR